MTPLRKEKDLMKSFNANAARRHFALSFSIAALLMVGCGKDEKPFEPSITISGTVTNNSGVSGTIVVEIDYNRRDVANSRGEYSIKIAKDYYIDSLYAWVDQDKNNRYSPGEPFGFYRSQSEPLRARPIHARGYDIANIDFAVP
jgi:hypothetical protein